jgi:hypothetical protein
LRFPHALDDAISMTAALAGHLPEITSVVSTQVALECLADKWNFNRRILPAIYWSFVHVPAHLVAALVISLVAFASVQHGPAVKQWLRGRSGGRAENVGSSNSSSSEAREPEVLAPDAEESLVLGLFHKNSSLAELIRQTEPVLLVVLYFLWPQVTIRTLMAPSCIAMPGVDGTQDWWLSNDPDIPCWESEHWSLILIAGFGFAAWSIGPLIYISWRVFRWGSQKYTLDNMVRFGYFYTGLAPRTWWWELLIKRVDIALFTIVARLTHLAAFQDERARLLWFTFISGIALALHEHFQAYDERQAGLWTT